MADFRKFIYATAMAGLLSAPAFAAGPLRCDASGVTPPFVRTEGHAELVGEVQINCTGGTATPTGQAVPRVDIRVRLTTNITSKLLAANVNGVNYNEVLLLIDEPNSGRYAPNSMLPGQTGNRGLLACGDVGAPDTSNSGPNVCGIIAPNHPSRTYDGVANGWHTSTDGNSHVCDGEGGRPSAGTFGCGRPNVFQGHQVPGNPTMVEFNGVPFDPPGEAKFNSAPIGEPAIDLSSPWVRTLRIVNLRTDANAFFVAGNNSTIPILADISFSGNTQAGIDDPRELVVAYATSGLNQPEVSGTASFVQCVAINQNDLPDLRNIEDSPHDFDYEANFKGVPQMFIRFTEGYPYSFKTRGWEQMQANSEIVNGIRQYSPGEFNSPTVFVRQNVPGGIAYHTESGFSATPAPTAVNPTGANPPLGVGTVPTGDVGGQTIANGTGIATAGNATNGTQLQIKFGSIPPGVTVVTPGVVYLTRAGTDDITGIAIRSASTDPTDWLDVDSATLTVVYEIMFNDPLATENLTVPIAIKTNLNQLPQSIDEEATVVGGFAPAPGSQVAVLTSATGGKLPRFFLNLTGDDDLGLFSIDKCNCNLMFPYLSNAGGFDTGVAIANTSLSPTDSIYRQTLAQAGPIQFWYFQGGSMVKTECTSVASGSVTKGSCPGTTFVKAGEVMTFLASIGSNTWGLTGGPTAFTGYMIAKSGFQYCHGFAFFSDLNRIAPAGAAGTSVGYLALVMDSSGFQLRRTNTRAFDSLNH